MPSASPHDVLRARTLPDASPDVSSSGARNAAVPTVLRVVSFSSSNICADGTPGGHHERRRPTTVTP